MSPSLILLMGTIASGFPSPNQPDAKTLVEKAQARAAKEGKRVYVMFDGARNEWARKHDVFLVKNEAFFRRNFVTVRLVPFRTTDLKYPPNPGAADFLTKWGGARAGLPYFAIIDAKGGLLGNSMYDHDNTKSNLGHPWTDPEVRAYLDLIVKGAARASKADISKLEKNLRAQPGREKDRVVI